jgi:hypothetical protein
VDRYLYFLLNNKIRAMKGIKVRIRVVGKVKITIKRRAT